MARSLKDTQGCDVVIALTHMRTPNDIRLAEEVDEIDLILGGHDHVSEFIQVFQYSNYRFSCRICFYIVLLLHNVRSITGAS